MKLRWRKRPSATVLHFSVLMTLGSALPLAISSSRPVLSMGARHPVRAVLATAWVMHFLLSCRSDTDRSVLCRIRASVPRCRKIERNQASQQRGRRFGPAFSPKGRSPCLRSGRPEGTDRLFPCRLRRRPGRGMSADMDVAHLKVGRPGRTAHRRRPHRAIA